MDAQWKDGSSFKHRWAELCHRAGIHDLNFHDLRHRAASWLLEAGIDYAVIEKLLVHRLHGMGEGYIHNWEHRLREAVRKLEAIVARKISETAQEIEKGVGSCGQLGSYKNFEFPKWWILWCRGTESNCRHQPFQGCALPTELPRHSGRIREGFLSTGSPPKNQLFIVGVAERAGFEPATGF